MSKTIKLGYAVHIQTIVRARIYDSYSIFSTLYSYRLSEGIDHKCNYYEYTKNGSRVAWWHNQLQTNGRPISLSVDRWFRHLHSLCQSVRSQKKFYPYSQPERGWIYPREKLWLTAPLHSQQPQVSLRINASPLFDLCVRISCRGECRGIEWGAN